MKHLRHCRLTIRFGTDIVDAAHSYESPVKLPRKLKKRLQDQVRQNSIRLYDPRNRTYLVRPGSTMSNTWQRHEVVILAVGPRNGRPWGIRASRITPKQFTTLHQS